MQDFDKLIELVASEDRAAWDGVELDDADLVPFRMAMKFAEGEPCFVATDDPEQVRLALAFADHVGATVETIQHGEMEDMIGIGLGMSGVAATKGDGIRREFTQIVFRPPLAQNAT